MPRTEETDVDKPIRSLFAMVEKGATEPDDPCLNERLATLKLRRSAIGEEVAQLDRQIGAGGSPIAPEKVARSGPGPGQVRGNDADPPSRRQ